MPFVRDHSTERSESNPIGIVVAVCFLIGALAYVLVGLIGGPQEAGFWLFAGVGGLLVYILTFVDLRIGISIMIMAVGISPEMSVEDVPNIRLEDFIVPVVAFSWLTRHIAQRESFKSSLLSGPIIAYIGVMLVGGMVGLLQETIVLRSTILFVGKSMIYFLMYLVILNTTRTIQELKAYTILLILVALISTVTSLGPAYESDAVAAGRLHGPFGETANIYAGYLIMMLSLMIGMFLYVQSPGARFGLGISALIVFYGLMVTLSRTSYIALMFALVVFGLFRARRLLVLTLLIFVLVPLLAPEGIVGRVKSIYTSLTFQQQESFAARVSEWQDAWWRMKDKPQGWGPGYIPLGWVDNEYLRVGVDLGFIGLAVFLWMLWRMGRLAFNNFDAPLNDPTIKGFAAGYAIAFLAVLMHAVGATTLSSIRTAEAFMLLAGLASALYVNREEWGLVPKQEPEEDPHRFGWTRRRPETQRT